MNNKTFIIASVCVLGIIAFAGVLTTVLQNIPRTVSGNDSVIPNSLVVLTSGQITVGRRVSVDIESNYMFTVLLKNVPPSECGSCGAVLVIREDVTSVQFTYIPSTSLTFHLEVIHNNSMPILIQWTTSISSW